MEEKIKNSCPNCCQLYSLKTLTPDLKSNIPLFLKCGHSMCECCVRNIVKFGEPIECKICLRTMEIKTTARNNIQLYKLFPVNVTALGELALELIAEKSDPEDKKEDFFIDLQAILDSADQTQGPQGQCLECQGETKKMCQQCATVICEDCFNKSHKNFVVFKNHLLQNIEVQITNNCKVHHQKTLEYYCRDCAKPICTDCLMVGSEKSCKNHDVGSTAEMNETFLSEVREIIPQVDTIFRRLTKTAVDIGHLLQNMENNCGSPELRQVTAAIEQHFSKLQATVQAHKEEVMNNVARLRRIEKESLLKAREEVAGAIKESRQVMNALKTALECEKNQSANLSALLQEARNIVTKPWCLSKDESNKDTLKVCVSEELCLLVSDYVQLVGNAQARYALRPWLARAAPPPPPPAPLHPPKLPEDVRFVKAKGDRASPRVAPARDAPTHRGDGAISLGLTTKGNSYKSSPEKKMAVIETVTSFGEKKPSIELKAGVQELAHITHMQDPHNFYVRRARDDRLLTEIEDQLRESVGEVPTHVSVGDINAVKYEQSWRRGRVDGIEDTGYRVTYVDYGYSVIVGINDLREVPATLALGKESRYPAALALRCRLANCEPGAGGWHQADTDLVLRMVDRAPVMLYVRSAGVSGECDVTTHGGVSVAHALSFHERAVLVKERLPYPEVERRTPVRLPTPDNGLRVKGGGDVIITHVISPAKFYVRESNFQPDYLKLCEDLNNAYNARDDSDFIYLPEPGMVCVVLVTPSDGCGAEGWARAQVTWRGAARVGVWLPDCGRQLAVAWQRLRTIDARFTLLTPLAIEVHLAGVRPRGGRWSPAASELVAQHSGRGLRLVVTDPRRRSLGAALLDPAAAPPRCLNQELVERQLADPDRTVDFQRLIAEHHSNHSPGVELTPQPQVEIDNATVDSSTTTLTTMGKSDQEEFPADRKSPIRLEAKILHLESPSLMYISLMHQQKTFNELFEDIQKFYSKRKTPRRENWKVNDRCCAFCIQSETWRRASILETEKEKVTVFYTDFACTETVPISNLKKLHSDFEVVGDAAIKCHLAGVAPAGGEWPSLTIDFLKEKIEEYKRVFVTKVGRFVEKSMPVEAWVWHTEQGSALEPDHSEWRCLNRELVRRGLALLVSPLQVEGGSGSSHSEEDLIRFGNIVGSVQSWLVPPPGGSGAGGPDGGAPRWLPAEPLRAAEFTATPTYIDNDAVIYLHDVSQQEVLEFIRDTLEMTFKEADPKAPYCSWRPGEPCVARYYLDSHFYRGTVVEVNAGQSTCLVQYVDYGNSELCIFADLRKCVALHQIPMQAHKCSLSRIKPVGDSWDLTILDYIHKAIVEKKCFVKTVGPEVNGVTPVDLKYDKLWINDHLVESGLAAYTDGSKPIEPQYKSNKNELTPTSTPEKRKEEESIEIVNSSSEPDYIVEYTDSSQASGSPDSFKRHTLEDGDGNDIREHEQASSPELATYPNYEREEFDCNINVINDTNSLELSIIRDPVVDSAYEELFETVKQNGNKMSPLNGIYEYKPCIALFEESWYRASILKYSEAKNLVKVRYVDYGNIGIVDLSDVREISKDWASYPTACVTARLHGVRVNPQLNPDDVTAAYIATFLDKGPYRAQILSYEDSVPIVELRNSKGELTYEKLVKDNVFLHDTCEQSISE